MDQAELVALAIQLLERLNVTYMVVGSFASGAYGEPRMTRDIDIVIDADEAQIRSLCAAFPAEDYYVSLEAALAARRTAGQFNVIHPESGNKIDFMIAARDEWGATQIARRQRVRVLRDTEGYAARPEDIILSKMLYYREGGSEKHLRDIAGILKVTGSDVDRQDVAAWAEKLGVSDVWQAILRRLGES